MSYNRLNYLRRVIEVQNIALEYKQKGCSQKWIYDNVVKNKYHISRSTFNNYMCVPAKSLLRKKLKNKKS